MSRIVPHHRPELRDTIRSGLPVGSYDWGGLGSLSNFCQGHGGMLIPWCAIGQTISAGNTGTWRFYVAPKLPAVERIWLVNLRVSASGGSVNFSPGGSGGVTLYPAVSRDGRTSSFLVRESLGAKTEAVGEVAVQVTPTGVSCTIESLACYEQTRAVLDATTDDYGVDITTLRARQPIADFDYQSVAGVVDAYKNLDCRRAGLFHWSTDSTTPVIVTAGSGSPLSLFPLAIPMQGAVPTYGALATTVVCAVYAKVDAGTGVVTFASSVAGDSNSCSITNTSFDWKTCNLDIAVEDFSTANGLYTGSFEDVTIEAYVSASDQLDIQAISIGRHTQPL